MPFRSDIAALLALFLGVLPAAENPIRTRVLAFYSDDRAHRWPDVLEHFTVGKVAARWPAPLSDPAWIAATPSPDDEVCEPANGVPPSRMSITSAVPTSCAYFPFAE